MHQRDAGSDELLAQAQEFLKNSQESEELAWAHMILGVRYEGELDWEAAVNSYSKGVEYNPTQPHTQYYCNNNLAFSLIQLGRFQEAEHYCHAAINVYPERHNAYKNLGLAYRGLGKLSDAAISFINATQRSPGDPRAWWFLEQLLSACPELLSESNSLRAEVDLLRQSAEVGDLARMQ